MHYYQPLWTLVGAGLKSLSSSSRDMGSVMPKGVEWINDSCAEIDPKNNKIRLAGATGVINYNHLVVAAGINCDWDKIEGLTEALDTPGVCSNYSSMTVNKTFEAIQNLKEGNAVFTFPNTPIKCAGAPQKIMYLTDAYLTKVSYSHILLDTLTNLIHHRMANGLELPSSTTHHCQPFSVSNTTQLH